MLTTLLNINGATTGTFYKAVNQSLGYDFGLGKPVIASSINPILNIPSDATILYGEGYGYELTINTLYTKKKKLF